MDEIGNLAVELQGKLLRVLQDGEFLKIGTSKTSRTDVRFIAATNKDLEVLMARSKFRKDLFYRLSGSWLHLPPVKGEKGRHSAADRTFPRRDSADHPARDIDEEAMSILMQYDYPGNVRELKSIMQSAVNLSGGKAIIPACLPKQARSKKRRHAIQTGQTPIQTDSDPGRSGKRPHQDRLPVAQPKQGPDRQVTGTSVSTPSGASSSPTGSSNRPTWRRSRLLG